MTPSQEQILPPRWIELSNINNPYSLAHLDHGPPAQKDIRVESGFAISVSQLVMVCMGNIDSVLVYGDIISNIGEMLLAIAPTLIIVRVGLGRGFDSVVETAHQHHASQGRREMQVKSIQFAEHRTTTTDASHFASLGAIAPGTRSGPDGNVHGADSSSERSAALGQAGSQKTEKVEVALDVV
ncbi:hypothetical protein EVG20_g8677 [Dentipellis fragilis]|uniref:Uncharacterized protein n=1 Tax=Dentipellis fragilis TaxID=205917 RepID=A0A4Y9Y594_9AGAM|nr:hypothetical protein EVG20_g8677 [Dentipellis fragilis]